MNISSGIADKYLVEPGKYPARYVKSLLNKRIFPVLCTLGCFMSLRMQAQIVIEEEPKRLYYSFAIKRITDPRQWKNFRDVFHLDKYLMGKNRIMGGISYVTGRVLVSDNGQSGEEYRHAIAFATRIRFFEQFSFNTNFFVDFNKRASARWISDYSYTIGRYNWRARKFNYGYENYINNKYSDNIRVMGQKFLEGYYFVSYQHDLPQSIRQFIALDASSNMRFTYFIRYAINYRDEFDVTHGGIVSGKTTLGIALRYTIFRSLYAESAAYLYTNYRKRQPWDPDYTYGFGWFDWRSFRMSFTYGNWAMNRFDNSRKAYPAYGFRDGQFKVTANWIW